MIHGKCWSWITLKINSLRKSSTWKNINLYVLLARTFLVKVIGLNAFISIWKGFEKVRGFISQNGIISTDNQVCGERYQWWNLFHDGKPLALLQGCSAKDWARSGISTFHEVIENDHVVDWEVLKNNYILLTSNERIYTVLREVCSLLTLLRCCCTIEDKYTLFKW